jgi:hypothetical protein
MVYSVGRAIVRPPGMGPAEIVWDQAKHSCPELYSHGRTLP